MEFSEIREIKEPGYVGKQYYTDDPLDVDTIIQIISSYINEDAVLYECQCSTFNEEGRPRRYRFKKLDQLQRMHDFPNPSIGVHAIYIDPATNEYKFDISTAVNTNAIEYSVDDRLVKYVRDNMELDRMEREAAEKKRNQEQLANSDFKK